MIIIPCIYFIIFLISQFITNYLLTNKYIAHAYFEKCVVYVFEVLSAIPIIFKIFYPRFIYEPVFNPNKFLSVKPNEYNDLFGSIAFVGGSLTVVYLTEIIYQRKMRWQLKLHHATTIFAGYV